jgi:hypothetical protein
VGLPKAIRRPLPLGNVPRLLGGYAAGEDAGPVRGNPIKVAASGSRERGLRLSCMLAQSQQRDRATGNALCCGRPLSSVGRASPW